MIDLGCEGAAVEAVALVLIEPRTSAGECLVNRRNVLQGLAALIALPLLPSCSRAVCHRRLLPPLQRALAPLQPPRQPQAGKSFR